jgi:hypothetical protein
MAKIINLIGQKFSNLTVIKFAGVVHYGRHGQKTMWLCKCDCGNERLVSSGNLRDGNSKSCGCLVNEMGIRNHKCLDLTGRVFCNLTVLKRVPNHGRKIMWLCQCACGNNRIAVGSELKRGGILSCGCLNHIDLTGKIFGRLTAIKFMGVGQNKRTSWLCKCNCGREKIIPTSGLRSGTTNSCGCLKKELISRRGENNPNWKCGKKYSDGYVLIKLWGHPNANGRGCVKEHTYVMSEYLGRPLIKGETVHHKNGIKDDNRLENLELWASNHTPGQRVSDLVLWAKELLKRYEPEALK